MGRVFIVPRKYDKNYHCCCLLCSETGDCRQNNTTCWEATWDVYSRYILFRRTIVWKIITFGLLISSVFSQHRWKPSSVPLISSSSITLHVLIQEQTMSLHPSCHSLWSRNMVSHSTTIEQYRYIWLVVTVSRTTNFLEGPHFKMKRSADVPTNTRHPYHSSQVLRPHCTCWSLHWPRSSPHVQGAPFAKGLESQIRTTSLNLAPDSWTWSCSIQHWFGNCLSSSTK